MRNTDARIKSTLDQKSNLSEVEYEKKLLVFQRDILQSMVGDNFHQEHLNKLCYASEIMLPDAVAAIMIYDPSRSFIHVRSAPSISQPAIEVLNHLVTDKISGLSNTTLFSNEPVYVTNTETDVRWAQFQDFSRQFKIAAWWSHPITNSNGEIIGSFSLSSYEIREPNELQKSLLATSAHLAAMVIQRERMEETLWHQSNYDPLTLLPNRELFTKKLSQLLNDSDQNDSMVALMFIDLDNFKDINDSYGHRSGDDVLIALAKVMKISLRDGDFLSRTGGDEFVVILNGITKREDASSVAQKFLDAAKQVEYTENIETTLSIGISIYPDDADSAGTLLRNADTAMYAAKSSGKNRFFYYRPELTDEVINKITLSNELRKAIQNNEFILHFQPIYCSKSLTVTRAETLIRWQHPDRGLLYPADFLSVAEEIGVINDLTLWIFRHVTKMVNQWVKNGKRLEYISINLSASDINQNTFDSIIDSLSQSDLPPEFIEIEITESMLMEQGEQAIRQLERIRRYGVSIAMDDFGTGYSSLSQIQNLPIDKLKIDKSFIKNIPEHVKNTCLTQLIINMAKSFSLEVIAEGVETKEQIDFLTEKGCDCLQGYLLAKPMDASSLESILLSH